MVPLFLPYLWSQEIPISDHDLKQMGQLSFSFILQGLNYPVLHGYGHREQKDNWFLFFFLFVFIKCLIQKYTLLEFKCSYIILSPCFKCHSSLLSVQIRRSVYVLSLPFRPRSGSQNLTLHCQNFICVSLLLVVSRYLGIITSSVMFIINISIIATGICIYQVQDTH